MSTVGSLFSGAGLLDLGLHLAGFQHGWLCESDPWRRELLRARFPGVPVFDDVRTLRGQAATDAGGQQRTPEYGEGSAIGPRHAERRCLEVGARYVDLIAGGFPCKGTSSAGRRNGFEHAETVLWHEMRHVVGELRPRVVLVENVRDVLSVALAPGEPPGSLWGTVLADLAALGFDAVWDCVPAAAVGAPHLRDRLFCIATHPDEGRRRTGTERATSWTGGNPGKDGPATGTGRKCAHVTTDWGEYAPAIRRWEAIHGTAPEPLVRRMDDGDAKLRRVQARVDRSRLSALGDGVHVYVAWLVGRHVMSLLRDEAIAA